LLLHARIGSFGIVIGGLRSTTRPEATTQLRLPWDRVLGVPGDLFCPASPPGASRFGRSYPNNLPCALRLPFHTAAASFFHSRTLSTLLPFFTPRSRSYSIFAIGYCLYSFSPCGHGLTYRFATLLHVIGQLPLLAHPLHHPPAALTLTRTVASRLRGCASCPVVLLSPQHGLYFPPTAIRPW
jgi:hypothetical protein